MPGTSGMGNHTSTHVRRKIDVQEHARHRDGKTNWRLCNPRGKFNIERCTGGRGV